MKKLFIQILVFFVFAEVFGQAPRFDHFDVSNGLSQNNINGLVIDDNGNVWAGTLDGLNRYNGYEFEVFKPLAGKSGQISGNHIIAMGPGLDGDVWITVRGGILNRYQAATNRFIQYDDSIFQATGINPSNNLIQTNDSLVWFSDGSNVGVFNLNNQTCYSKQVPNQIYGISMAGDSTIIHGAFGIEYVTLNARNKQKIIHSEKMSDVPAYYLKQSYDRWYAVSHSSIREFTHNFSESKVIVSFNEIGLSGFFASSLNSFAVYKEAFWLGANNLLMRISSDGGSYTGEQFTYRPENNYSFKGYHVTNLEFDEIGNLWIGTLKNGLNHFNNEKNLFSHYNWSSQTMSSPDTDPVRAICKTSAGDLWLGFDRNGVGIIDSSGHQKYFNYYYTRNNEKSPLHNVRAIYEDSRGNIWIGEADRLCVYNPDKQRIETIDAQFLWDWPYRCYSVKELEPGILTITASSQIGSVNLESDDLSVISLAKNNAIVSGTVRDIVEDQYNNLWVAKDDNGLLKVEYPDSSISGIRKETHYLSDNKVYCMLATGDHLWIGTNSGLNLFKISENKVISRYFEEDGLSNNIVYSINQDNDGYLWMSTNKGISRFNPETEQFKTHLANDFFMDDAHYADDNGRIYYGGYTGIISFYPEEIDPLDFEVETTLEKFRLFNREIFPGDTVNSRILLNEALNETDQIKLKHHENSFTIDFNAFPFDYPNHNAFRYRLKGLQEEWIYPGESNRQASYTVVPPGDYIFQVQAASTRQAYGPVTTLNIEVVPPFWQTVWFKLSLLLLVIIGVFGGYQFRLRQIRKRNVLLKSRVDEQTRELKEQNQRIVEMSGKLHEADQSKLRFFTNISHDFRTPLTLILAHLDNMNSNKSKAIKTIRANAFRLLNLINQLIDLRKLDQGQLKVSISNFDVVEFTNDIVKSFDVLARQKNIDLQFYCSSDKIDVWLDHDKTEKVLYNLLSNAIKYTPAGKSVMVAIENQNDGICVDVEDNGIGMSEDELKHIFDRFYRSENGQEHATGHGIGLTIVKGLTEVQKGTIDIKSEEGKGTRFRLKFRKGYRHFDDAEINGAAVETFIDDEISLSEEGGPSFTRFSGQKMLIVEDNVELSDYLKELLENHFSIEIAGNGHEAFEVMTEFVPDLIISDIMMPVMDGIEFCRKVKSDISTSHIPFILLTAKTDTETHIEGFELGVDDYVEKPFNSRIFLARLKALLDNRQKLKRHFDEQAGRMPVASGLLKRDQEFILAVNSIIEERYGESLFNVETLSAGMFMSRSTFYRKFKDLTGVTAADYIRKIRLHKASLLLKHDEVPASQVSELVGFQSVAHFRRCFKAEFGETPGAWGKKGKSQ